LKGQFKAGLSLFFKLFLSHEYKLKSKMGFNKKTLPSLRELKDMLRANPALVNYDWGADALIGPSESIDYIEHLWVEYQQNKLDIQSSSMGET